MKEYKNGVFALSGEENMMNNSSYLAARSLRASSAAGLRVARSRPRRPGRNKRASKAVPHAIWRAFFLGTVNFTDFKRFSHHDGVSPESAMGVKMPQRIIGCIVVMTILCIFAFTSNTYINNTVCEDLHTNYIVTGEVIYKTVSGNDSCYNNQYADGGDQIDIPCYSTLGALDAGTDYFSIGSYLVHIDNTASDCTDVTFINRYYDGNDITTPCDTCLTGSFHTHNADRVWDSCDSFGQACSGNECYYYVSKFYGVFNHTFAGGDPYWETYRYWKTKSKVTGKGCTSNEDIGCLSIINAPDCEYVSDF